MIGKCSMWIWNVPNVALTFPSCLFNHLVIVQFIVRSATVPTTKIAAMAVVEADNAQLAECLM